MNATFHFTSAQELTPAILDVIRQVYQEQPISIYIRAEETIVNDWEMRELKRREQIFLEPDDDFRRAITADELKERMHVSIREFFADKQ